MYKYHSVQPDLLTKWKLWIGKVSMMANGWCNSAARCAENHRTQGHHHLPGGFGAPVIETLRRAWQEWRRPNPSSSLIINHRIYRPKASPMHLEERPVFLPAGTPKTGQIQQPETVIALLLPPYVSIGIRREPRGRMIEAPNPSPQVHSHLLTLT